MKQVNEIAETTLDLLQLKLKEVNRLRRTNLIYDAEKRLERIKVAIEKSMETIRRAKLDNGIPEILRR